MSKSRRNNRTYEWGFQVVPKRELPILEYCFMYVYNVTRCRVKALSKLTKDNIANAPGLAGPHSQLTVFISVLVNIVRNFYSTEDKTMD